MTACSHALASYLALYLATMSTTALARDVSEGQKPELHKLEHAKKEPEKIATPRNDARDVDDGDAKGGLTTLAVVKTRKFIKMIYTLDLKKDNALSPAIAEVMRANEAKVRACYLSRLEENPDLRGELGLRVLLSGESGKVKRVAPIKGGLSDKKLLLCVARALVRMPLNAPKTTKGTLVFSFDVLDDKHID